MKINTISSMDPRFPSELLQIPQPPQQLFVLGNCQISPGTTLVTIVGTRKPTAYGRAITTALAEGLARRGVIVVSGLALGVDGVAHQAAVRAGGRSFAVLAGGLDKITPSSHRDLAIKILEHDGALLSEYPSGTPSLAHQFLERNRLVSGLSSAVIVTEAAARSGTMNTVGHALEQGRDVYAVPGNITSPMSQGCNSLIEQGAVPIVDVQEFLERFSPADSASQPLLVAETDAERRILELMETGITDGEILQQRSGLDAAVFSSTLTMLELRGVIRAQSANHWSR